MEFSEETKKKMLALSHEWLQYELDTSLSRMNEWREGYELYVKVVDFLVAEKDRRQKAGIWYLPKPVDMEKIRRVWSLRDAK